MNKPKREQNVVQWRVEDGVGHIVLNRPEAANAGLMPVVGVGKTGLFFRKVPGLRGYLPESDTVGGILDRGRAGVEGGPTDCYLIPTDVLNVGIA